MHQTTLKLWTFIVTVPWRWTEVQRKKFCAAFFFLSSPSGTIFCLFFPVALEMG